MTFSNTDSDNLERIARALERQVELEERRNDILLAELAERKAAWEQERRDSAERFDRAFAQPTQVAADPWRDLPEDQQYIQVRLQSGPIGEVGVNGAQIDDVIRWCRDRLDSFNQPPYQSRHNGLAMFRLDQALQHLADRTAERQARGVEGTSEA